MTPQQQKPSHAERRVAGNPHGAQKAEKLSTPKLYLFILRYCRRYCRLLSVAALNRLPKTDRDLCFHGFVRRSCRNETAQCQRSFYLGGPISSFRHRDVTVFTSLTSSKAREAMEKKKEKKRKKEKKKSHLPFRILNFHFISLYFIGNLQGKKEIYRNTRADKYTTVLILTFWEESIGRQAWYTAS